MQKQDCVCSVFELTCIVLINIVTHVPVDTNGKGNEDVSCVDKRDPQGGPVILDQKKKKLPTVPTMRALRLIFTLIQFGMFHECLMNNFRTLNVNENQREIFLTLLIKIETPVERVAPQNT